MYVTKKGRGGGGGSVYESFFDILTHIHSHIQSKSLYVVKNHHRTLRSLLDVYEDPRYTQEQKINWLADKMETCPVGKVSLCGARFLCLLSPFSFPPLL